MYYLDEDINITVNIPAGIITDDSSALYRLEQRGEVLFTGSCFIPKGATSKTIRVNELIEDHKWKNDLSVMTDFSTTAGLVGQYTLSIQAGIVYSKTFEVASIYRYPHRTTAGLLLTNTPDTFQMMADGYNATAMTYRLTPHIPFTTSGDFIFPLVFESNTGDQIRPCIKDYDGHEYFTMQTTCKKGYDVGNFTLYSIFGQTQLDRDADLYLAEDLADRTEYYAYVAHIDYCPARYYLVWQDRYGATQSQPFNGTCTYGESFVRAETLNSSNTRQLSNVNVQPKFTVTSNWLNFNNLPYFESLFVSPWLQLWDTETGMSFSVVITDTDFSERTFMSNNRQMFSYTLNLETAKKQNILW